MMLKSEWQFLKQHKMMLVVMYDADRTYRRPRWAIGERGSKAPLSRPTPLRQSLGWQ
ncbi:hypothetical protein L3X07_04970 [Levilactobacillus brevis]|nr:hypothetical protein [Levilactobacillus brevis]